MFSVEGREFIFEDFATFEESDTIFIIARNKGVTWYFLISEDTNNVYSRKIKDDTWEELSGYEKEFVFAHLDNVRNEAMRRP